MVKTRVWELQSLCPRDKSRYLECQILEDNHQSWDSLKVAKENRGEFPLRKTRTQVRTCPVTQNRSKHTAPRNGLTCGGCEACSQRPAQRPETTARVTWCCSLLPASAVPRQRCGLFLTVYLPYLLLGPAHPTCVPWVCCDTHAYCGGRSQGDRHF